MNKFLIIVFFIFCQTYLLADVSNAPVSEGSESKVAGDAFYLESIESFFLDPSKKDLKKKLLASNDLLKEFILDFYSDLNLAELSLQEGYGSDKILQKKVDFYRKKLLIEELMNARAASIKYPDFEVLAKESYIANIKNYTIKEKRKVAHILIKDAPVSKAGCICEPKQEQITVDELLKKIENNEDFSELAKKYSKDLVSAKNGGVLPGYVDGSEKYLVAFEDAAYQIKKIGGISKVVRTRFGAHIIKLLEIIPPKIIDFEVVKVSIMNSLKENYKKSVLGELRSSNYPDLDKLNMSKIKEALQGKLP